MVRVSKQWNASIWTAAIALAAAGCVAVDVGEPSVRSGVKTIVEEDRSPARTQVVAAKVLHQSSFESIRIGLGGDLREEYRRKSHTLATATNEQKRLAFGLFPGAAEEYLLPRGAEKHACYRPNYPAAFAAGVLPAGLFVALGTVHSLLFELPFGSFDCWKKEQREGFSHLGIAGFHKYTAVIPHAPERGPDRDEPSVFKVRENVPASGPYSVEFSIPGLVYSAKADIGSGAASVSFPLPRVREDYEVEARVTFSRLPGRTPSDAATRLLLAETEGKSHRFTLFLHPPPKPPLPKPPVPSSGQPTSPPPRPQATSQSASSAAKAFEIAEITPFPDGRYEVRVRILDRQKTLTVGWDVVADVKRLVHDTYLSGHPAVREHTVRETVRWATEEEGHVLVYTAWAFSVQPVLDSWRYSSDSRRGSIALRIVSGMGADEAKRWARENISAIVADKNVLLRAGGTPPPGAIYRSLDEEFSDGLLTIEFEAIE